MPQYLTSHTDRVLSGSIGTQPELESDDGHREDDEAHLTTNMSHNHVEEDAHNENDPENNAAVTPRSRRTIRYSVSPSPLKKTESALKSMSHNIRRASLRVVNLASAGLDKQLRLGEDESEKLEDKDGAENQQVPDLKKVLPIRGRTLGFLGPESKLRHALFDFLVHP